MEPSDLYNKLEKLAAMADEVRDLATQSKPISTKNAAYALHEAIVDLMREVEDDLPDDWDDSI